MTATQTAPKQMTFQAANLLCNMIPTGKYVVMGKDGATPYFFEIKAKVKGSDQHRIYRLIGSPGDYQRTVMNFAWQQHALRGIAADAMAASALYGKVSKHCGVCGAALTDPESLERGIGPVCYKKF
jgi:hypothetical protein